MPSLQSHIFRFVMKHGQLLRFQLKRRKVIDFNTSIASFREDCEKGAAKFGKMLAGIEVSPLIIEGISAEWFLPSGAGKEKVILYTHGGGYVSGSCSDHRAIVANRVVTGSGIATLLFEYRLASEHPYPAAVEDSVAVYRWLLAQGTLPSNIVIVGESYRSRNKVSLAPLNSWTVFSKYYVGDNDPSFPWISPLYGELHGLPPFIPEARQAMDEICEFIKTHIN